MANNRVGVEFASANDAHTRGRQRHAHRACVAIRGAHSPFQHALNRPIVLGAVALQWFLNESKLSAQAQIGIEYLVGDLTH